MLVLALQNLKRLRCGSILCCGTFAQEHLWPAAAFSPAERAPCRCGSAPVAIPAARGCWRTWTGCYASLLRGVIGRQGTKPALIPALDCCCTDTRAFLSQSRSARPAHFELRALAFDAVAPAADRSGSGVAQQDAQQRAALAEQLGYRTIGAELPEDVSLGDVIQSMPKSVSPLPRKRACLIFF